MVPKTKRLRELALVGTGLGKACAICGRVAAVFTHPDMNRFWIEWSEGDVSSVSPQDLADEGLGCGASHREVPAPDLDLVLRTTDDEATRLHAALRSLRSVAYSRAQLLREEMRSATGDRLAELDRELFDLLRETHLGLDRKA